MAAFVPIAVLLGAKVIKVIVVRYLWKHRWLPYDPAWLIELVHEQRPEDAWVVEALAHCTHAKWESDYYIKFKPYKQHGVAGELQACDNIVLIDPVKGEVILDVHTDGCISGLDFLGRRQGRKAD